MVSPTSIPAIAPGHNGVSSQNWPGWPHYDEAQIDAVSAVLRSGKVNFWTGDICRQFEQEYAASIGVPFAIAVANGTNALELALELALRKR